MSIAMSIAIEYILAMPIAIEQEKEVYILRLSEGRVIISEGWVKGRNYEKAAFDIFLKDETKSHVQTHMYVGGDFVADFSKVGEVYQYSDEYGRIVQISYMTPDQASFINNGIIYEM
jgi:hypothetical protein